MGLGPIPSLHKMERLLIDSPSKEKNEKSICIYMCRAKTKAEFFGENRLKADFIRHLTTVSPTLPSTTSMTIWATSSSEASASLNTTAICSALTNRWSLIYRWKSKILKIGEFSSLVQIIVSIVTVKSLVLLWDKVFHKWHSVSQRHYLKFVFRHNYKIAEFFSVVCSWRQYCDSENEETQWHMGHIEMKCYDIASITRKAIYEDIKRTKNDTDIPPNIDTMSIWTMSCWNGNIFTWPNFIDSFIRGRRCERLFFAFYVNVTRIILVSNFVYWQVWNIQNTCFKFNQTWYLSKILHSQIFRLQVLHCKSA